MILPNSGWSWLEQQGVVVVLVGAGWEGAVEAAGVPR